MRRGMPHPGTIAAATIAALVVVALGGLVAAGGDFSDLAGRAPYLVAIVASATRQAALSTLASLLLGTALALALERRARFPGRSLLVALIGTATVAPTIVVVFGLIAVYGRAGPVQAALAALGLPPLPPIYGLSGILLAHVAMNAPFVARVMLGALGRVPDEQLRLATALRFGVLDTLRHCDGPVIRREAPALAAFVFLLCFTSFAVVLSLGGGPANATLEVAIYEALRIDVDFARAAMLAGLQIVLGLGFVGALGLAGVSLPEATGAERPHPRPDGDNRALKLVDAGVITLAVAAMAPPVLGVIGGVAHLPVLADAEIGRALATSLALAALAALVCVVLAVLMAASAYRTTDGRPAPRRGRAMDLASLAILGLPPYAFVAGLYVVLRRFADPETIGLMLVPLVNALMALPFAYRLIAPAVALGAARHGRLAASLRIAGLDRLRLVDAPLLRGPVLAAAGMAAALSLGDFGVIALFGGGDLVTLPYVLADRMGAYRMNEAAAIALVMVGLAAGLGLAAERLARAPGEARNGST
ncbi:MAG: thiamine/thiamine pyrophosphate ABC transporter permease ThiP [Hyphomicrobiaceae bacterium]|nr:thiamine/thiamine pyrophosphate ABC transporter permease ThiP [Hyphomicrobiaceae bacterium]